MPEIIIILLWPTARPEVFKKMHKVWMDRARNKNIIFTEIAVDSKEHYDSLSEYKDIILCENPRGGITTPLYELTKNLNANEHDIIVVPSDDFYPPEGWDNYLLRTFDDWEWALRINDDHIQDIIPLPIMTYRCLLRLNRIIYHPVYNHMFSDQELFDVLKELDLIKDCKNDKYIFEHKHHCYGKRDKDEVDEKVEPGYHVNKKIYEARLNMSVENKLIV